MIRIFTGLWMLVLAGPSMALELCDELWFGRNLVFDQAGYCFGSPLGKAVFDNADCTTSSPVLNAEDQAYVAWVKEAETAWECHVDSAQTAISLVLPDMRRRLVDRVAVSGFESACFGWSGGTIELRAGHGPEHEVIGYAQAGDNIHWENEWISAPGGWEFLTVKRGYETAFAIGWSNAIIAPELCASMAG